MFTVWSYLLFNAFLLILNITINEKDFEFIIIWLLMTLIVVIPLTAQNL